MQFCCYHNCFLLLVCRLCSSLFELCKIQCKHNNFIQSNPIRSAGHWKISTVYCFEHDFSSTCCRGTIITLHNTSMMVTSANKWETKSASTSNKEFISLYITVNLSHKHNITSHMCIFYMAKHCPRLISIVSLPNMLQHMSVYHTCNNTNGRVGVESSLTGWQEENLSRFRWKQYTISRWDQHSVHRLSMKSFHTADNL